MSTAPERVRALAASGIVASLLVGGGAFAYTTFLGDGAQPQDVMPKDMVAFVRVDLDPSASQKIAALKLLRRIPDFEKGTGITSDTADLRKVVVSAMFDDCDIDFAKDVEPWLGQRVGFGLHGDGKSSLLAMQIEDEDEAREGIAQFDDCAGTEKSGVAFRDGYALVTDTQKVAERLAKEVDEGTLAESRDFQASMKTLGDAGIASAWIDPQGFVKALAASEDADDIDLPDDFALSDSFADVGPAVVALRVADGALELRGTVDGAGSGPGTLDPAKLPAGAVGAVGWSVPREVIDTDQNRDLVHTALIGFGMTDDDIAGFNDYFGLNVIEDLITLYTSDPVITVGNRGLADIAQLEEGDLSSFDIAVTMRGDSETAALARRILRIAQDMGVHLEYSSSGGIVRLASSKSALNAPSGLDTSPAFRSVLPDRKDLSTLVFLDVDAWTEAAQSWDENAMDTFVRNAGPVRAFGGGAWGDTFRFRLSFD